MTAENQKTYLTELDRLVEAELQTLVTNVRRHIAGTRASSSTTGQKPPREKQFPSAGNVVRAHPLARRKRRHTPTAMESLFAPDEAAFLANAIDWLRGRQNADILIDALSREVLEGQAAHAEIIADDEIAPATIGGNATTTLQGGQEVDETIALPDDADVGDDPDTNRDLADFIEEQDPDEEFSEGTDRPDQPPS